MNYLRVNPFCGVCHYEYYFNISTSTARRHFMADKKENEKKYITFQDFFRLYGGFPDPKFIPVWKEHTIPAAMFKDDKIHSN